MGVSYVFINVKRNEQNEKPVLGFGGLVDTAADSTFVRHQMIHIFHGVIKSNGWSLSDKIKAEPNKPGRPIVEYHDGTLHFLNPDESSENESV